MLLNDLDISIIKHVSMSENHCVFVSSRGILKSCLYHSRTPVSSIRTLTNYNDFTTGENGSSIYVCLSALKAFIAMMDNIPYRFVLVTGDCDNNCYTDMLTKDQFETFINHPKLIHWFSQNCISNHPKLTKIPIGLDYHTISSNNNHPWGAKMSPLEQEAQLIQIKNKSRPFYERCVKAYANYHFQMGTRYGGDRIDAEKSISRALVYYEPTHISRENTWNKQCEYAFIVSPHGNGYDCHRTWEALILGCIPIVKTSNIDELFVNLPVLIVKEWSQVTQELLNNTIIKFKEMHEQNRFQYERLLLQYWVDKIRGAV
jgi:hypothetical protein